MIKNLRVRMAEVGKVKIGKKGGETTSKNGKKFRLPQRLDYFSITTTEKDKNGDFIENKELMKKYDPKDSKPKRIPIRFLFDDTDINFNTSYQCYSNKKLICHSDGISAERRIIANIEDIQKAKANGKTPPAPVYTSEFMAQPCNPKTCLAMSNNKCKVSGILTFVLDDMKNIGGVYKFRTHSYNSVTSILGSLEFFKANTNGILQGILFDLVMLKKETEDHGTIDYVTLVLNEQYTLNHLRQLAAEEAETRKKLGVNIKAIEHKAVEDGITEDTDRPEDVYDEFYADGDDNSTEPVIITEPAKKGTSASTLKTTLQAKTNEKKIVETTAVKTEQPEQVTVTSDSQEDGKDSEVDPEDIF